VGIVLIRRRILTYGHVVNRSLGRDFAAVEHLRDMVPITFSRYPTGWMVYYRLCWVDATKGIGRC
jgi:hypothetical protein